MTDEGLEFFKRLLETPSPSGFEQPVQKIVREYVAGFADEVEHRSARQRDRRREIPARSLRVMLAGHCDQIGFLVQYIDAEGFLWLQPIGGWDPQVLIGQKLTVWTDSGPVLGVIARKPIHLLTEEERKQVPKLKDLWLDIGAKNREDAAQLVRIGDPVTLELGYRPMLNGLASSPAMDDKCGLWVAVEALRRTGRQDGSTVRLYAVSTVQEEIGLRGAHHQHLWHRPAGGHRHRRDARHRLPDDRQEAGRGRRSWARAR